MGILPIEGVRLANVSIETLAVIFVEQAHHLPESVAAPSIQRARRPFTPTAKMAVLHFIAQPSRTLPTPNKVVVGSIQTPGAESVSAVYLEPAGHSLHHPASGIVRAKIQ
jgi:hypothetical protein